MVINMLEWYGEGGIRFRSPAPPLPHSYSCVLAASSLPTKMDHGKRPREESPEAGGPPPRLQAYLHEQG
jgi:hypothetical protein